MSPRFVRWTLVGIIAAPILLAFYAGSAHADGTAAYAEGLEAYDAGRYADASNAWERAAAAGNAAAMVGLAGLYDAGMGVARNPSTATVWYRRAAEGGYLPAQAELGDRLSRGLGTAIDLEEGYFWLSVAAERGHAWAAERKRAIGDQLPPSARNAVEARVEAALPKFGGGRE